MNLSHSEVQVAIRRYARRFRLSARVVSYNSVLRFQAIRSYRREAFCERYNGHTAALAA